MDKVGNAQRIKQMLESLNGRMNGMRVLEVGIDFSAIVQSHDIVLYTEFETREALYAFQQHPECLSMKPYIFKARIERIMVDYEI